MSRYVWTITVPGDDCQCWRDAVCTHNWTWQEPDPHEATCVHDSYYDVYDSFADAVRALFPVRGGWAIGPLLRKRPPVWPPAFDVYVMPAGSGPFVDDHDATGGPSPFWIISRRQQVPRSTPRSDPDGLRRVADHYRRERP